jgi:hypothetical protein
MALSLDYIGKFVIVLVVLAVAIALIVSMKDDILGNNPIPEDNDREMQIIKVDPANPAERVANLITLCWDDSRENRFENRGCFVVRADGGTFSFGEGDIIGPQLDSGTWDDRTDFDSACCTGETIVIRYDANQEAVRVLN